MSIMISLRADGLFEAATGERNFRIGYDDSDLSAPWVMLQVEEGGAAWEVVSGYNTLDQALEAAASSALDVEIVGEFSVRMPDGTSFKRPGRKGAEEVLASFGWYFVTDLIGFALHRSNGNENPIEIRNEVKSKIKNQDIRVQDVSFVDDDEGVGIWVVDLLIAYGGWLKNDEIQDQVVASLLDENLEVSECYDFRKRINIAARSATIIPFPTQRIVRVA